jgi:CRP-like cAMP-binding protein
MDQRLTLIEKTAFLKGVDVLSSVPSEALLDLAMRAKERHLEPGQALIQEGEPNQGTFLVMEGTLEERHGLALVRIVRPRMAVGELYLGEADTHIYTVRALEHAHVLHLTIEDVFDSIADHPELAIAMVKVLSFRLHEVVSRVLALEDVVHRLIAAMRAAGVEPPDIRADAPGVEPAPRSQEVGARR